MRHLVLFAWLLGLVACVGREVPEGDLGYSAIPIPGTTYRLLGPMPAPNSPVRVDVFTDERACRKALRESDGVWQAEFASHEERIARCVPRVDRNAGLVHLAFRITNPDRTNQVYRMPISDDDVEISHKGFAVQSANREFQRHEASKSGRLFIILVDHSSSMYEKDDQGVTRMQRVRDALWKSAKTFVSAEGDTRSAVAILAFSSKVTTLDGDPYVDASVYQHVKPFRERLMDLGKAPSGWTHLYDAVRTGAIDVPTNSEGVIGRFLSENDVEPTIVVLTDGFNNTHGKQTCGDNATELSTLLGELRNARKSAKLSLRPTIYAIGFGSQPLRPNAAADPDATTVTARTLCGDYDQRRIDSDLDKQTIDNVSLVYIGAVGGGRGYTARKQKRLQEIFESTAPERYGWYDVTYMVDGFHHRNSFETRVRVVNIASGNSLVEFQPSGWLDAPSGHWVQGQPYPEATPIRQATALTMPLLGFLVFMSFLGAASFNARRAIFRRARGPGARKR